MRSQTRIALGSVLVESAKIISHTYRISNPHYLASFDSIVSRRPYARLFISDKNPCLRE
jgi:hypothetical protein